LKAVSNFSLLSVMAQNISSELTTLHMIQEDPFHKTIMADCNGPQQSFF